MWFRALRPAKEEADHAPCRLARASCLTSLPASAREADFDAVARGAEKVEALEPFLARYIGQCTDVYEQQKCEANVAQARKQVSGRARIHGAYQRRCRR